MKSFSNNRKPRSLYLYLHGSVVVCRCLPRYSGKGAEKRRYKEQLSRLWDSEGIFLFAAERKGGKINQNRNEEENRTCYDKPEKARAPKKGLFQNHPDRYLDCGRDHAPPPTKDSGDIIPPLPSSPPSDILDRVLSKAGGISLVGAAFVGGGGGFGFFFFLEFPPWLFDGLFRGIEIFPVGGNLGFVGFCLPWRCSSSIRASSLLA